MRTPSLAGGPRNRELLEHDRPVRAPVLIEKRPSGDRADALDGGQFSIPWRTASAVF
jgi:hypothetical protein